MLGFVVVTIIFLIALFTTRFTVGGAELDADWETIRCRPDIILTCGMYGKNTQENIEYCMSKQFNDRAQHTTLPFYSVMGSFASTLSTMISSIGSTKLTFATIAGSASTVFTEFSSRLKTLMSRIQLMVLRIKLLMGRIFSIMYSILYMGQSGITAGMNLFQTPIWDIITGFACFDPDTPIHTMSRGKQTMRTIQMGEILENGQKVTAIFKFYGDGQKMVILPGDIIVSGPHNVLYENNWVKSAEHPDAIIQPPWSGGVVRPLMCINTSNHSIKLGSYTFTDYDETVEGNIEAMNTAIQLLNGNSSDRQQIHYVRACHPNTMIKRKDGKCVPANSISLGMELSHGHVMGVVEILTEHVCYYGNEIFTPATAIWSENYRKYTRIGEFISPTALTQPVIFYSFLVSPSAIVETSEGTIFRDYIEVHSHEIADKYEKALYKFQ
jgi:hypothetical protein